MSELSVLQRWRPGFIVLALLIAVFLLLPHVYGNESLLFTLMTFIVLAQGLNLLYGFTGYLPFGYVGFFGCGAYATSLLVLVTALAAWFRRSAFGMGLRAMKQDPVSAAMAGINIVRARLITWLISAGVAGLAGGVYAWNLSVFYPEAVFTLQISVFAIVFSLFGGVGTVIGPIIGASVLYSLYSAIGISTPQYFQLIYGLLIVLLVLFMPGGVLSLFARRGVRVF